jgi:hypothetical protein
MSGPVFVGDWEPGSSEWHAARLRAIDVRGATFQRELSYTAFGHLLSNKSDSLAAARGHISQLEADELANTVRAVAQLSEIVNEFTQAVPS